MDDLLLMRIIQRLCYLLSISDDDAHRNWDAPGMVLAQRPVGGIVRYQIGAVMLNAEMLQARDIGVVQAGNPVGLEAELLSLLVVKLHVQDFDDGLRLQ